MWSEEGVRYKRIRLYEAVDRYVLGWFAFEIVIFIAMLFFFRCDCKWFFIVPLIFIIYRLLEILQAWVSQFILGGVPVRGWKPLDVYRSLVLVCVGYVEIIFSYAFIVLFCWESFDGIEYGVKALHYSVSNAVTIGSDVVPRSWLGYTIFGTQVIFILLFITAVIGFIIGGITRDKGNTG
ncbi:MAG TPA: hypothetical protein G4O18_03425 [Dehalococcoidia bacterium]|nr:hypothetical protein [Dehalococcoidia bacterium]